MKQRPDLLSVYARPTRIAPHLLPLTDIDKPVVRELATGAGPIMRKRTAPDLFYR